MSAYHIIYVGDRLKVNPNKESCITSRNKFLTESEDSYQVFIVTTKKNGRTLSTGWGMLRKKIKHTPQAGIEFTTVVINWTIAIFQINSLININITHQYNGPTRIQSCVGGPKTYTIHMHNRPDDGNHQCGQYCAGIEAATANTIAISQWPLS